MSPQQSLEILDKHLRQLTFQKPRDDKNSTMNPTQLTQLLTTIETFGTLVILFPTLIPNHQDKLQDLLLSFYDKEDGFWKYNKTINEKSHFTFQYELMIKPSVLCTSILSTISSNFQELKEKISFNNDDILKDAIHNLTNWIHRFHYHYVNHHLIDWWNMILWITRRLHISTTLNSAQSQPYRELIIALLKSHLEETNLTQEAPSGKLITFQELHWRLTGKFLNFSMESFKDDPLLNILAHKKLLAKWLESPQLLFEDLIWLPYPKLVIPKSELGNIKRAITTIAKRMNIHNTDQELNLNILIGRIQQAQISN